MQAKKMTPILRQTIKQTKKNLLNSQCFTYCPYVLDQSHYHYQVEEDSRFKLWYETCHETFETLPSCVFLFSMSYQIR